MSTIWSLFPYSCGSSARGYVNTSIHYSICLPEYNQHTVAFCVVNCCFTVYYFLLYLNCSFTLFSGRAVHCFSVVLMLLYCNAQITPFMFLSVHAVHCFSMRMEWYQDFFLAVRDVHCKEVVTMVLPLSGLSLYCCCMFMQFVVLCI